MMPFKRVRRAREAAGADAAGAAMGSIGLNCLRWLRVAMAFQSFPGCDTDCGYHGMDSRLSSSVDRLEARHLVSAASGGGARA